MSTLSGADGGDLRTITSLVAATLDNVTIPAEVGSVSVYPKNVCLFAAVASIIFVIVGIIGNLLTVLALSRFVDVILLLHTLITGVCDLSLEFLNLFFFLVLIFTKHAGMFIKQVCNKSPKCFQLDFKKKEGLFMELSS